MSKPAAIPYFGDAYLADTRHLSLEEHGAYHLLILIAWRSPNCSLPDDDRRLAQMLGITAKKWEKLKPVVMAFWTRNEHGFEQKRLTKEFLFVTNSREQKVEAANARWSSKSRKTLEDADADASNPHMQTGCGSDAPPPPPPQEGTTPKGVVRGKRATQKVPLNQFWNPKPMSPNTKCAAIVTNWTEERYETEIARFKAHHGSRCTMMADWDAAWQTWVLNADKFDKQGGKDNDRGNTSRNAGAAERAFGPASTWSDQGTF